MRKQFGTLARKRVPVVDLWTAMIRTTGWKDGGVDVVLPGSSSISPSMDFGRPFYDGLHLTQEAEVPECQIHGTDEWYPEWIRFHPPAGTRVEASDC